jgi:hypothetical protein
MDRDEMYRDEMYRDEMHRDDMAAMKCSKARPPPSKLKILNLNV